MAKGRCHSCAGEESELYLLLKCPKTQKWGEEFLSRKWHHIKQEITTRKMLTDKNDTELRQLGTIACK